MTQGTKSDDRKDASNKPRFYRLNPSQLPDHLYRKEVDVTDWIGDETGGGLETMPWMETTDDREGFRPGSLARVAPLDPLIEFERNIAFPLYNIANASPILLPMATAAWLLLGIAWTKHLAIFVVAYQGILNAISRILHVAAFRENLDPTDPAEFQYTFHARHITMYCSTSYVWPDTLHRPALSDRDRPVIFCVIPHGMIPSGIVGYPFFSKVWNSRLCSWTSAPITHKLPFIGSSLRRLGYLPAKSKPILEALTRNRRNIGIILDGIEGVFRAGGDHEEAAAVSNRKGICKIALKAGATIVPVYGFGHKELYDMTVDPLGVLEFLSTRFGMSIAPFFGRWGWFMGPPKRDVPLTMCLGDPIFPPEKGGGKGGGDDDGAITQEQIDEHHSRLLEGFTRVFETHKKAYYGEEVGSKKKLVFV
mmetsp:Transcript_3794/g.9954  ORF Transcript_3794/g.9954 Transcript_3794/m.9954 type:complete len:421 (-) Transcript_3794:374-1636(-)